ncbi:MAG TPA: FAD binding domain-containing protein [Candidatus Syntrophosphaera sp.]|nr:FAD binding domain-containing protein [Candidatus Syntrophosphaera sp.]
MDQTSNNMLHQARDRAYQYNRIVFWLNGERRSAEIAPAQTTLEFLQQDLHLYGTKCSCNEGDCGACTVTVASPREGRVVYEAVNSCLYNAAKLHGKHLITVEGLGTPAILHPIQKAMLNFHATQCGYCSPGFVMSLFALLATLERPNEEDILAALEGNLCRCTGYDSILKAARHLAQTTSGEDIVPQSFRAIEPLLLDFSDAPASEEKKGVPLRHCERYQTPSNLDELSEILREEPDAVFINGGTDIMVQMNVQRRQYRILIDLSSIAGLDAIASSPEGIRIGANCTYSQILAAPAVKADLPYLSDLIENIASQQIRNFATLAGNVANASPIGDTLPLLLVLGASLVLFSADGESKIPLREFFLDYRKTALRQDEIIKEIIIPIPPKGEFVSWQKAAKRKAVDISSVVSAIRLKEENGVIKTAELACGGVAVVPKLSMKFYKAMLNMELQGLHPQEISEYVASEFSPISDVRGSDQYRTQLLQNHVLTYLQDFLQGRGA